LSQFGALGLDPRVVKNLDEIGFVELFPIQERAINPLLQGRDVIGQAKTGTGKTVAYAVPMIQRIDARKGYVQGLVLTPTRELAVQVASAIRQMVKYTNKRVLAIYGGQPVDIQCELLRRDTQIVIGTPGRVIDLIRRGVLKLGNVESVVLDEADTMLDMGFIDDVEYILREIPLSRQLSLFSATMPEKIVELSNKYMKNPQKIIVDSDEPSVETLTQEYILVERRDKRNILTKILREERYSSIIIFCATKIWVDRLAHKLDERFYGVTTIHSGLSQHKRDRVMQQFRTREVGILVATDIAARGLDISHVDCIINYDVPKNPLMYFHRVGRTARAGGAGKSYILVSQEELEDFIRIQDLTTVNIKPASYSDRKEYSKSLHNLKNIHNNESENVDQEISKYCGRCEKMVAWVLEGALCKCTDCGKILR